MLKGRSVASGVPPQSLVMVCYGRLTVWFSLAAVAYYERSATHFLIMDASFPSQTMCDRLLVPALSRHVAFHAMAASGA